MIQNRISLRAHSKVVEEKRRTIHQPERAFGRDLTNIINRNEKKDQKGINTSRKTVLKLRSSSFNGRYKEQIPKIAIAQYQKDIIQSLMKKQVKENDVQNQIKETVQMSVFVKNLRKLTFDWIIDIHERLKLADQTLYLFFQYFDEYHKKGKPGKLQFREIGIACLWMASKFEEVRCPSLSTFMTVSGSIVTKQKMKQLEYRILETLDYQLIKTTPLHYLSIALGPNKGSNQESFCKYLLEISYLFNLSSTYKISTLAIAAINICQNNLKEKTQFRKYKEEFMVTHDDLSKCLSDVKSVIIATEKDMNVTALKRKYGTKERHEVSKMAIQ